MAAQLVAALVGIGVWGFDHGRGPAVNGRGRPLGYLLVGLPDIWTAGGSVIGGGFLGEAEWLEVFLVEELSWVLWWRFRVSASIGYRQHEAKTAALYE